MQARILELRHSHSETMLAQLGDLFAPLDPAEFAPGLTVLENALFGKVSQDIGSRADDLRKMVAAVLIEFGAQEGVVQLIYDLPI
ncbi:hypothetical protein, partial [Nocardioides sp. REDSEA-S30_B4]|uniref:hypothetical protein n=1 Tax=Nocardioides sp. REDSEA-S30_B4 TaxID=1811552 RepID=UPI0025D0667E